MFKFLLMTKIFFFTLIPWITFCQVKLPVAPQTAQFTNYSHLNYSNPNSQIVVPNSTQYLNTFKERQLQQDQQIMREIEQLENQKLEESNQIRKDIDQYSSKNVDINYNLPSFSNIIGTEHYRNLFDKMLTLNVESYSVKDLNFEIENAFFENQGDKNQFDQIIKNSGDYILAIMKELKYDLNSNTAKNYMLFQFFAETLQLKSNGKKHFPFKYDFDDYIGVKDYSKMFVSKLLATKTGQCHSMPLLYLILAEQIGAEAFLSFSPSHSFIKFRDEKDKWYNVELTNGMFTANSFIVNSGYIKAEALQNQIYMKSLSKQELLSQFYVDLADGYIHKFGYDEFVEKVVDKALELYPNNIHAQMIKANYKAKQFENVAKQLRINPRDNKELQRIKDYPKVIALLQEANSESKKVEELGYTEMPAEAYQEWLNSLKQAKYKQENETYKEQFKLKTKTNFKG